MVLWYLGPDREGPDKLCIAGRRSESAQSPAWVLLPIERAGRCTASLRLRTCARQGAEPSALRPRAVRRNQERRARPLRRRGRQGPMWRPARVPEQADGGVAEELDDGGEERLLLVLVRASWWVGGWVGARFRWV